MAWDETLVGSRGCDGLWAWGSLDEAPGDGPDDEFGCGLGEAFGDGPDDEFGGGLDGAFGDGPGEAFRDGPADEIGGVTGEAFGDEPDEVRVEARGVEAFLRADRAERPVATRIARAIRAARPSNIYRGAEGSR